ncbi:unnamed protein product [Cuscuta epithymum]|uniref:DUF3741 domain-containing protein n=2 Tax=Cuscuta epithymum TaxID=186058 RepID=A0AAV0F7K4_9ASTE|nr:unnamed protein product [Cuscuta epithymum]
MLQDSLKSIVYRLLLTCDDPKGVVECKMISRSKDEPWGDKSVKQVVHNKEEMVIRRYEEAEEELNSSWRGAQDLNRVIDSWPEGESFDRQSKDIAKDLLKGALELQDSLLMLGKLQEASKYLSKLKKMPNKKVRKVGRDCYDELREVIRESFARQNLLPTSTVQRVSFESREFELFPDVPSTSSSQSALEKNSFYGRRTALTANDLQQLPSIGAPLPEVKQYKPKGPNLIAKLMGLEQIPPTLYNDGSGKDMLFHQRRPVFEIDLPKAKKPHIVTNKVDPRCKTLEEIIETMQFKGLLKSRFVDGSKHGTCEHNSTADTPQIVIMKPCYAPQKHQAVRIPTNTSPVYNTEEKVVRKSSREGFSPDTCDTQKRVVDKAFYKNPRAENGAIKKPIHKKGAKEKLPPTTTKVCDPAKPRKQNNKEVNEKKLDNIQKVGPTYLRKKERMKNVNVKYADKSNSQTKLRKEDEPHTSEKQLTWQKSSISNHTRKNMKTDKPLVPKQFENKEEKDVKNRLISKKNTCKYDKKADPSEKVHLLEASGTCENHLNDDHITNESVPCEPIMLTGIEHLRSYEDFCGRTLCLNNLYSLIEKDLFCKGWWDLGWSEGFSSDEIVADIEKQMLCGMIEGALADFAS